MPNDQYINLWAAVIRQAITDLDDKEHSDDAREWLLSKESEVGSLMWICKMLKTDINTIRDRVGGINGDNCIGIA